MNTIDCLSEITGLHYEIELDGDAVTITWTDADGIEQAVDSIAPGGVLAACDVPAEDQAILCEEVARLAKSTTSIERSELVLAATPDLERDRFPTSRD